VYYKYSLEDLSAQWLLMRQTLIRATTVELPNYFIYLFDLLHSDLDNSVAEPLHYFLFLY